MGIRQFTMPQLAARLDLSPNYLSQVINEQLNKNFFDFVNHYRIEEAKRPTPARPPTRRRH